MFGFFVANTKEESNGTSCEGKGDKTTSIRPRRHKTIKMPNGGVETNIKEAEQKKGGEEKRKEIPTTQAALNQNRRAL